MKAHRFGTNYFKCLMVLKMTSWKCTLDVLLAASKNSSFLIDGFHSNKAVTHMRVIKQPAHSTHSNPVFILFTRKQANMTRVLHSIRKGPRKYRAATK